ncbi:uncharacterized protein At4g15970-like [Selaginella moellendorffii]|uniref:uncharacterized protein At4g15970-like n=1 Tax=Selaginella moellendorffii TaxID=88036 RepID=UPI000D1C2B91|nr:uncharacterized protein At4g15970-like [Selaginella moellendorffii]|eukprot:XP_024538844.1 uncharacterized protein At4g15970-like [Selaginella moellendorffii]
MGEVASRYRLRRSNAALMILAMLCFGVASFYIGSGIHILHESQNSQSVLALSSNFTDGELTNLAEILTNAAMDDNKTVILAPLNSAWAKPGGILDVFLESFRVGEGTVPLLDHLVIIALDKDAYDHCLDTHKHCFRLEIDGVDLSVDQFYMSQDYVKMNKRRLYFQGIVLQLGFNFIFTDLDIVWLRSPIKHFSEDADFQVTCDRYSRTTPNMGLVYARSNERTIQLFSYWHTRNVIDHEHNEQEIFMKFRHSHEFLDLGIRLRYLSTRYFGGLCDRSSMDINTVCTMHVNCCKGTAKKAADLKLVIEDWKVFKSTTTPEERKRIRFRAPRQCRKSLIEYLQ